MRIGFDGKRMVQNFTGLGNYSRFILDLLTTHYPNYQYHVYAPKKPMEGSSAASQVHYQHPSKYYPSALWRSYGVVKDLKKDGISVYHGLSNELPFSISSSGIPSVVTIHDLIFLRFPEFYPIIDRSIYRFKCEYACKHASKIIAVSEQTKRDLISYFQVPESKIEVVYQACHESFQEQASDEFKKKTVRKYKLPKNYILQVGTIEKRKNLVLTIKALRNSPRNIKLVVIGRPTEYIREVKKYIEQFKLESRVIFLRKVPLADLPAIYQQARIFIYPSEFEGFGIPIVEALFSGVPVIAASGSCLEEAGGPDSCYIHPKDDVQLSWNINAILNNPDVSKKMTSKGLEYVNKFKNEVLAKNLMDVYNQVIQNA